MNQFIADYLAGKVPALGPDADEIDIAEERDGEKEFFQKQELKKGKKRRARN